MACYRVLCRSPSFINFSINMDKAGQTIDVRQKARKMIQERRNSKSGKNSEDDGSNKDSGDRSDKEDNENNKDIAFLSSIKKIIKQNMLNRLDGEISSLGIAYLLGDKTEFSGFLKEQIKDIGVTHLVVISGMHLAILTEILFAFVKRFPRLLKTYIVGFFVVEYVAFIGISASLFRAGLVIFCRLFLDYFGRKANGWRVVLFVGAISLIICPEYITDIAWQLSMLAYIGIIVVYPLIDGFLFEKGNIKKRKRGKDMRDSFWIKQVRALIDLRSGVLVSIAVSLICFPLLIYYFGSFSLISIVATLLLSPILPIIIVGLVFIGCLPDEIYNICYFVGAMSVIGLKVQLWIMKVLSGENLFMITMKKNDWTILLLFLSVTLLLGFLHKKYIKISEEKSSKNYLMMERSCGMKDIATYLIEWKEQSKLWDEQKS